MCRNYVNRDGARAIVSSLSLAAQSILHFFVWQMTCQLVVMFWSTARNLFIVKCSKEIRMVFYTALCSELYVFLLNKYNIFSTMSQIIWKFYKSLPWSLELFEFAELSGSESEPAVFLLLLQSFRKERVNKIVSYWFWQKDQGKWRKCGIQTRLSPLFYLWSVKP